MKRWWRVFIPVVAVLFIGVFLAVHLRLLPGSEFAFPFALQETPSQPGETGAVEGPEVVKPAAPTDSTLFANTSLATAEYDPLSDANNYGLSSTQCTAIFGPLYKEIERSLAHRKKIGNVKPADIDLQWKPDFAVRAMIYNRKLHILETKFSNTGYDKTRALAALHQIDRAITASSESIRDIEFSLSLSDITDPAHAHHTIWSLSRLAADEETWLMPDFGYWSWPLELVGAYEQIRAEIRENEGRWEDKVPKALWRGAVGTNKVRSALVRATRGKEWADVQEIRWKNRTEVSDGSAAAVVPMTDHCAYRFLLHTEGRSYSGRGKYLLNCNSVVVMHKREWLEPHQDLLVSSGPGQNFVEVERDFSDLEAKVKELLNDPQRARTIANNSVNTFRDRYLTPAAQACYWRQLFRAWADVSFRPQGFEIVNGKKRLRGVPFESFVIKTLESTQNKCSFWKKITFQC